MTIKLPNIISILRLVISPVCFLLITSSSRVLVIVGFWIFLISAISDFLDGWFARRYHETTQLGKFLDPLADKFLTTAAFLAFVQLNIIPLWMVLIIIIRDIGTTLIRVLSGINENKFKTSFSAKIKTALQMVFIGWNLLLIFLKSIRTDAQFVSAVNSIIYSKWTLIAIYIITLITIWTAVEYLISFFFIRFQSKNNGIKNK